MGRGRFHFNQHQKELILQMEVSQMIEIFSITNSNVSDFLYALHIQPREIVCHAESFDLSGLQGECRLRIFEDTLSIQSSTIQKWFPLGENYRLLGIYLSEHVHKDPFLFLSRPEKKKPKITIEQLFFEMSLGQIGKTSLRDIMDAEILPPKKERALKIAIERRKAKKQYTVGDIFTRMPLSKVGQLTISEFFGAQVFGKKKKEKHL